MKRGGEREGEERGGQRGEGEERGDGRRVGGESEKGRGGEEMKVECHSCAVTYIPSPEAY